MYIVQPVFTKSKKLFSVKGQSGPVGGQYDTSTYTLQNVLFPHEEIIFSLYVAKKFKMSL